MMDSRALVLLARQAEIVKAVAVVLDRRAARNTAASLFVALAPFVAVGQESPPDPLPSIAVFSGPTATIQNNEPFVTSIKAREQTREAQRAMRERD